MILSAVISWYLGDIYLPGILLLRKQISVLYKEMWFTPAVSLYPVTMAVVCLPSNLTDVFRETQTPGRCNHYHTLSHHTHTHQLNLNVLFVLQQKIYKTPPSIKCEICVWHLCCNDCTLYPVIKVFVWCDHRGGGGTATPPPLLVSTCQSICRLVTPMTETVHGDN